VNNPLPKATGAITLRKLECFTQPEVTFVSVNKFDLERLKRKALEVRRSIVALFGKVGGGHFGGSLSATDIVVALCYSVLRIDPKRPRWPDRDRFVLSKGHSCPAVYTVLADSGYFPKSVFDTFEQLGNPLTMRPDMTKVPGIDMSTGSMGRGLPVGVGMALAGRLDRKDYQVFVLMGDGETQEGSVWEAAMAASHYKLDNLVGIVDRNRLSVDGWVEEIMSTVGLSSGLPSEFISKRHNTYIGAPPSSISIPLGTNWDELWKRFVDTIYHCNEIAEDAGFPFVIEPLPYTLLYNTDGFIRLAEEIGSENLGCVLDVSHTYFKREDIPLPTEKLKDRLMGIHINNTDGEETYHWQPGKGSVDWHSVLRVLKKIGYERPLDLEIFGKGVGSIEEAYREGKNISKIF